MKSQVNFVYDIDDDPQDEVKHWLFLENVRLQQERQELVEERQKITKEKEVFEKSVESHKSALEVQERKLCKQKEIFEKKWQILENELRRYARDRDRLAKDKIIIERERENLKRLQSQTKTNVITGSGRYFAGVSSVASLKKRYRELLKIYHPDNEAGDETAVLLINQEYKNLKKQYGID